MNVLSLAAIDTCSRGFLRTLRRDGAATAVEYALMITLIAVVIFGAVAAFGTGVSGLFEDVASTFP